MAKFRENVAAIEEMLKKFMDDSFTKLRSAEGAFDLLQKFRSMQSQEASQKLMERKTVDILSQYEKELDHVNNLFQSNMSNPPLSKNQPPLAGAINWSHSLFLRVRKTIAKFQQMDEDLFSTDQGKEVSRKFVQVSKAIRRYEKALFEEWKETVNQKAMQLLKQPSELRQIRRTYTASTCRLAIWHLLAVWPFGISFPPPLLTSSLGVCGLST